MVAVGNSSVRAVSDEEKLHHHNHNYRLSVDKTFSSLTTASSSETLLPIGSGILTGYHSGDKFKSDSVEF
jgi:hypothetical protein